MNNRITKYLNGLPRHGKAEVTQQATKLADRQVATILAALRHWQANVSDQSRLNCPVATDGGRLKPLTDEEIDNLCEIVNR